MGVLGLVFGLILTGIVEYRMERNLHDAAQDSLSAIASSLAHRIGQDVGNRHREVALMADLLVSNLLSENTIGQVIDGLKARQPIYAWIGLADKQGVVLAATDGLLVGQSVASRPWFKSAMVGSIVGDPHEAKLLAPHVKPRLDGEPPRFVDVAVPLLDEQKAVIGVLGAHLYWDWVQSLVRDETDNVHRRGTVEVLIADEQGQWLLTPLPSETRDLMELFNERSVDEYVMVRETVKPVSNTNGLGWTIVIRENVKYAHIPIKNNRHFMFLFAIALATMFAWLTWVVGGKVVKPILKLAKATQNQATLADYASRTENKKRHTDETELLGQFMNRLAHRDLLTGLSNKKEITTRISIVIKQSAATESNAALLLLNLDNFGVFNNVKGYEAGDQILIAVAKRLGSMLGENIRLSRINGDEFLIVLQDLGPDTEAATDKAVAMAQKILFSFNAPFAIEAGTYTIHTSVGVCLISSQPCRVSDVLSYAELAMRSAKHLGKNQLAVFTNAMQTELAAQVKFEEDLAAGIPNQLALLYQPQVDENARVEGAELLVRWNHPEKGMVSPHLFIPLAEETGLIIPIGRWVMKMASDQIKLWEGDPNKWHLILAVNVSTKEFGCKDYVEQVAQILRITGANPARLKLELTESALANDIEDVINKMHELKRLGLSFALDDFGTGFSSLSYLQRMPIDQLKIDKSFVQNLAKENNDTSIVQTIIVLGKNLGVNVIAEGVEESHQKDRLFQFGCKHFQGYLYGQPMPLASLEKLVLSSNPKREYITKTTNPQASIFFNRANALIKKFRSEETLLTCKRQALLTQAIEEASEGRFNFATQLLDDVIRVETKSNDANIILVSEEIGALSNLLNLVELNWRSQQDDRRPS
jgi:diguanylate cyclase (GGDEF)-like protein